MDLDFLDKSLPIVPKQEGNANNELDKFRKYCKALGKTANQLTKQELEKYYNS